MKNPFAEAKPVAKKLKVLLYGASGTGKTLAALSFPRVAMIDAESGSDLYAGRPGVLPFAILRSKTITELEQAVTFIREDNGKTFDTLVIDPITVFYDVLKEATARTAKHGEIGFREWSKINTRMKNLYNALTTLPVHVVIIAREATEYETTNGDPRKTGTKPDADKALTYLLDFVIRLNPDHSGTIIKSRGVTLGKNGVLPQVNWQALEPASLAYVQGETVIAQDNDTAIEAEMTAEQRRALAEEFKDLARVEKFVAKWKAIGYDGAFIMKALGVEKISEWTEGEEAAQRRLTEAAKLAESA